MSNKYKVIEANIIPPLIQVMRAGDFKSQKEATWAITNLTSGGNVQQIAFIVQCGVLKPFCDLLESKDWKCVSIVLDGLHHILSAAEKLGETDRVALMVEEADGLDKLEALQAHENEQIYQKASSMIDAFFSEVEGDQNVAPTTDANGQLDFKTPPVTPPQGGFQF